MGNKKWRVVCIVTVVLLCAFTAVSAQKTYPTKAIEAIVPWGAGGVTDTIARNFVAPFEKDLGVPIVITNKAGASGAIGSQFVLTKPADGYTILFSAETLGTMKVLGMADIDFRDFEPIILISGFIPTVTVSANAPWNTVQELIEDAKKRPGKIIAGYAGPGSTGHISSLLFSKQSGAKLNIVPFGSGAEVSAAILGGHVDVVMNPLGDNIENYKAGKLKLLATFTNEPVKQVPLVPALGKAVPEFQEVLPWGPMISILVKKGTPEEVKEKLKKAAIVAVNDEKWIAFLDRYCANPLNLLEGDFWKFVDSWISNTTWILYDAGVAKKSPAEFGIPRP